MATYIVTNNNDSGAGSLRQAIIDANVAAGSDNIQFAAGLAGSTILLTSGELTLTQDVTIDGDTNGDDRADVTISGNNSSRIFNITGATTDVDLLSLTLTSGYTTSTGGAIQASSISTLDILDSTISNSTAVGRGGGIRTFGTDISLTNVLLSNNNTESVGGGANFQSSSVATLTNVTVYGNSANASGGGIYISGTSSATLFNSTVTGNQADADGTDMTSGGGIANFNTLTVTNSVIAGNTSGGALPTPAADDINGLGSVTTSTNSFFGTTETINAGSGNINGGGDPLLAALADNGGTIQTQNIIAGSQLINAGSNAGIPAGLTEDANGDARIASTAVDIGATEAQFSNTLVVSNAADVVDSDFSAGNLSLREAVLLANNGINLNNITFAAALAGQTLTLTQGELLLTQDVNIDGDTNGDNRADITISGNNASRIFLLTGANTDVDLLSLTLTNGYSMGAGGAIFASSVSSLDILDSTISGNVTLYAGGGIRTNGTDISLTNVLLSNNSASGIGGGANFTNSSVAILTNITVYGNSANFSGGGIAIDFNSSATLFNSTVTGNLADSDGFNTTSGGGIYNVNNLTVTNSVIAGNTSGGALPTPAADDVDGNVTNSTNSFFGTFETITNDFGGNINYGGDPLLAALADNGGTVQTQNIDLGSQLINGGSNADIPAGLTEDANGDARIIGAIVDIGATEAQIPFGINLVVSTAADVVDTDFSAGNLSLREAVGLALSGAGSTNTITFAAALAGQTLILTQGELLLTEDVNIDGDTNGDNKADITISGNNASRIFNMTGVTTDVDLLSLTLTNGNTTSTGGAINASSIGTLNILDSTISNNTADSGGGGIRTTGTDISLTNVLLNGNISGYGGGGANFNISSVATLTNTTVYGNSSNSVGGGISVGNGSSASLFNSTVTGNQADADGTSTNFGGGIYNDNNLTVTNSVIADNTSGGAFPTPVADNVSGNVTNSTNSFFGTFETLSNDIGGNSINYGGDPLLGELLDNGGTVLTLSPLDGSQLIGAGLNSALPADIHDIDGDANTAEALPFDGRGGLRIVGGIVDIGAVEQIVNETITGTSADNNIIGGLGNDTLDGGGGNDTSDYSAESQSVEVRLNTGTAVGASSGSDTLISIENVEGSNFNDLIFGDNFANVLNGNGGDDEIFALGDADTVNGGDGNDTLNGNLDGDVLNGDAGDDLVLGAQGNDNLNGGADNDTVSGGSGDDTVSGGSGMDLVFGGGNNDLLFGNDGNDVLSGGGGLDTVSGGNDDDLVLGAGGNDNVFGGAGADTVSGGSGVDIVTGGDDNDQVFGAGGNDTVSGGAGNDTVSGGTEDDRIFGNADADNLIGASGTDRLDGGTGDDILTGGSGADTLVFAQNYDFDTVQGFEDNIDTLELDQALWGGGLTAAQVVATFATQISPGIVEFDFTGGDILRVINGAGITTTALVDDIAIV